MAQPGPLIVKVQMPVSGVGPALIYGEGKTVMTHVDDPQIAFMLKRDFSKESGGLKGFYHAVIDSAKRLHLGEKAPWQEW
jgi:hypothetical protein